MRKALLLLLSTLGLNASVVVTTSVVDFAGKPVRMNFDAIAAGTDISGQVIDGVRYIAPGSPLLVVDASSTNTPSGFTDTVNTALNTLPATSGANILSPGGSVLGPGPNPSVESDWLTLEFQAAVTFFGFDLLSQSADGVGFTFIRVYDENSNLLYSGTVGSLNLGGGGAPGGAEFWGITASNGTLIARVEIQENDNDARYPDANIGFDSLRYGSDVPEPSTWALMGMGGALVALGRRRR